MTCVPFRTVRNAFHAAFDSLGASQGESMIARICVVAMAAVLAGCSGYQVHSNLPTGAFISPTYASQVQVLYSPPQRAYESVGIVSAKRYKPGWTDPSLSDAIPQLQAAGAQLGANAVIVRSERSLNDRHVTVEAEAIRYTDSAAPASPSPAPTAQPCASCQNIGKSF